MSDPNVATTPAKRTYPWLTKWAGIFTTVCVAIVIGVQLFSWFAPPSLPDCDNGDVQNSLRDIFSKPPKATISAWDNFTPGAKSADSLACTANLTFSDMTRALLSYRVFLTGKHVMVAVDNVKAL